MTWIDVAAAVFFGLEATCVAFLLAMALYQLGLIGCYRRTRGADPPPARTFPKHDLPHVTVQLPVYNEGRLAERCLRAAASLDYPPDRLEIQFLDDSDDGVTSRIARDAMEAMRRERPDLAIESVRRADRAGFKAGALKLGTSRARGEFLAIFDADFLIPKDFLSRTIHYFTDPDVAAVQARWSYVNRERSLFSRLQAVKLDAHQMFEQTARARSGLCPIFHGSAGIWRASALEEAGGWNCLSEVEDVEISIRSALSGRRIVYLDHLRVPSELPETMNAFVRQQMRWKRGWTRVVRHYTGTIAASRRAPLRQRLDLLQRIHLSWGPVAAFFMTLGALPFFLAAQRLGLMLPGIALYASTLVVSLATRYFEERTLREDPQLPTTCAIPQRLRWMPFGYLLVLGTSWALTQATLEGFGHAQIWEVTPKSGTTPGSSSHRAPPGPGGLPLYALGTLATAALGLSLVLLSLATGHVLAMLFYALLVAGCGWVGISLLRDLSL